MQVRPSLLPIVAVGGALAIAGCGKAPPGGGTATSASAADAVRLSPTTPSPSRRAGDLTWAVYREVQTVDPIKAFDFPDNNAVTAMCDSLLRQEPDGTITSGIARVRLPNARTIAFDIDPRATFWDGTPVTASDVVYSLRRSLDPAVGGFYGVVFSRVTSVAGHGRRVTIRLRAPDTLLLGELSQMAGVVVQKAFAEKAGKAFGTPDGGTMCSGAYRLGSWRPGTGLKVVPNASYWRPDARANAASITFTGVSDDASLTSGLTTGAIDGTYQPPLSSIAQLQANPATTVTAGPSYVTDAIVISNLRGVLRTKEVRQALSMAIDRAAYIQTTYNGLATLPRTLANPGTWGYGRGVFERDWDARPDPAVDIEKGRRLVRAAGATGKTLTLGMSTEVPQINTMASAVRTAAEAIGLEVKLQPFSAANFINLFVDPKAREGIDAFPTSNYPDFADPAAFYATFAMKDGSQNYSGFEDPAITKAMNAARAAIDETKRAKATVRAGDLIADRLPWIPVAAPSTILVTSSDLTGAPPSFVYMGGPWAASLGAR
ncbi:ABC transporter substrate-binding protein [Patulibacter sp. S7RM1-6]